jgi:hypothetical protein
VTTPPPRAHRVAIVARRVAYLLGLLAVWSQLGGVPLIGGLVPPAERRLYLKLPIEGVTYHWEFTDAAALLAGQLTLRILNGARDTTIVIFADGQLQDGWRFIGKPRDNGRAYFGFSTDRRVRTSHRDSLILTLTAATDLAGQGSYHEGILRAGTYHVSGSYSSLYGRRLQPFDALALWGGAPIAFMECWDATWPLDSIVYEGWKGSKSPVEPQVGLWQSLTSKRGTTWRPCGSHL